MKKVASKPELLRLRIPAVSLGYGGHEAHWYADSPDTLRYRDADGTTHELSFELMKQAVMDVEALQTPVPAAPDPEPEDEYLSPKKIADDVRRAAVACIPSEEVHMIGHNELRRTVDESLYMLLDGTDRKAKTGLQELYALATPEIIHSLAVRALGAEDGMPTYKELADIEHALMGQRHVAEHSAAREWVSRVRAKLNRAGTSK